MLGNKRNIPDPHRDNVADTLFRHLLYLIATGKWLEGMRLPSIRDAEKLFRASRSSVQQAYKKLAAYQLVDSKPKSGYIVKKQPGDAWISRNRDNIIRLHERFSKTIKRTTGLTPLPVFRYLTMLAAIHDHENPSCAFVECTLSQAEGHAREIKERLGVSVLATTIGEVAGKGWSLPSHVGFVITTRFHHTELLRLQSKRGLQIIAVPIEVSPLLRNQVELLKEPFVFLETEKQMAQDIAEDAQELLRNMPISTMTVDDISKALSEMLLESSPHRNQSKTVLLSPRDWGTLDERWRNHPSVKVVTFSICESAWNTIAEFLGMPIGPLG